MMGHALRALDLTDAQREQIRTILESHKNEFKPVAERMIVARQELNDAVTAGVVDEAAIRGAAAKVAAVEADAAVMRAKVHAEVFAVLTPEQQAKARELKAQARERLKQRLSGEGPGPGFFGRGRMMRGGF
jgi:protein CpxP